VEGETKVGGGNHVTAVAEGKERPVADDADAGEFISQVFPAVTNDFLFHSLLTLILHTVVSLDASGISLLASSDNRVDESEEKRMDLGDERPWNQRFSRRLRVSQGVPQAGSKVLASLSHTRQVASGRVLAVCVREASTGWDPGHVLWVPTSFLLHHHWRHLVSLLWPPVVVGEEKR
jgi:hypothetical protein